MAERGRLQPSSPVQRKALDETVARYAEALTGDAEALSYLESRGLTLDTVRTARLGVVKDPDPLHLDYTGWLVIPYLRYPDDEPVTVRFRCIENHKHAGHGKYESLPEDPLRMYGVSSIHEAEDEIHLTEGELDSLILRQVGYYACGLAGPIWNQVFRNELKGFRRVWYWADPDPAGAQLARKIERSLSSVVTVPLKLGDVSESYMHTDGGADYLRSLIDAMR